MIKISDEKFEIIVKAQDKLIKELDSKAMASAGIMHARGVLEEILRLIHSEMGSGIAFNATNTAKNIDSPAYSSTKNKVKAIWQEVTTIYNNGSPAGKACLTLYQLLSTKVHQRPAHGPKVR